MIPVAIVTGFLGSGKTTFIGRVLGDVAFARTAVIVNEFGEIGLDHELIETSDETLLALTTGCLCCAVRSDLVATLLDLRRRREAGEIAFDRVLIETSGLADPAPILHALMTDADLVQAYAIDGVVTLVDAVHGEATLDHHAEARRQVAVADCLLISKTDLLAPSATLITRLQSVNPGAIRGETVAATPAAIFSNGDATARVERLLGLADEPSGDPFQRGRHSDRVETFSLIRETPLPALALTLLLQALAEHCGGRLLRLKGLVDIAEMPGQPALIHGVQHVFSAPRFLAGWPSADRRTRLVFIAQNVPRYFPLRLLAAIEQEVREEMEKAKPSR